jgi:hypothetical protein
MFVAEPIAAELAEITPREYISPYPSYPDYGYPFTLGDDADSVKIAPTDGRHCHVGTKSGERTTFVHRGREYQIHFSQHVYRHADGTWNLSHPDPEQNSASNGAGNLYGAEELPAAGRERLRAAILDAARSWTADHPDEIANADRAALNNAARRREEEIAKLAGELATLLAELRKIESGDDDAPRY